MIIPRLTPLLLLALVFAGCAAAPDTQPPVAATGTPQVIQGVDFWKDGPPSRPYQVIATVARVAPDKSVTFSDQEASIAAEASQKGADAVVEVDAVMVVTRIDLNNGRPVMAPKIDAQLIKYQ